jgi:hypothetical protein
VNRWPGFESLLFGRERPCRWTAPNDSLYSYPSAIRWELCIPATSRHTDTYLECPVPESDYLSRRPQSDVHGRPRFAKPSIDDGGMVRCSRTFGLFYAVIQTAGPDGIRWSTPRSLTRTLKCRVRLGFCQPRSRPFRHHFVNCLGKLVGWMLLPSTLSLRHCLDSRSSLRSSSISK